MPQTRRGSPEYFNPVLKFGMVPNRLKQQRPNQVLSAPKQIEFCRVRLDNVAHYSAERELNLIGKENTVLVYGQIRISERVAIYLFVFKNFASPREFVDFTL